MKRSLKISMATAKDSRKPKAADKEKTRAGRGKISANSHATPHSDRYGRVVKEFTPLRQNGLEKLCLRVLESKTRRRRLDIRKYVEQAETFTKAGISLSSEEFDMLLGKRKKIQKLLDESDG